MSKKTAIGQTPYVQQEDTTIQQPISMYEASKEFYRMEKRALIAARYVRNSDPSKKDSEVLKAQADALLEYGKKKGYECPDHLLYADAISALKYPYWERKGLMRMWDDAERGEFDVVLVTEYIRVARRSVEQYAVMEYLKRFHVELESITEKFEDTAEGRLLHAGQAFLGEAEAEKTRIRTTRGKLHRAKIALTGQGDRMYGYKFADTKEYSNGRYVVNNDIVAVIDGKKWTERDVLAYERRLCLQGMSVKAIAVTLTRMGIPTITGNTVWHRATVQEHLTNENYRGYPYAVNNRFAGRKNSGHRINEEELIPLPEGIYPRIVDPEEYDAVQEQLRLNQEMAARNNQRPNLTLLRDGLVCCGICGRRMYVHHHTDPLSKEVLRSEYECNRNEGGEELSHNHCVAIVVSTLDPLAWEFALPYIRNSKLIHAHVENMRGQLKERNHLQPLKERLEDVKQRIINLFDLGETARDADTKEMYRQRLAALEHEKRETEKLIHQLNNTTEREEKLRAALDKFEAWCETQRPLLDNPQYEITQKDKHAALLILGVKAFVWPTEGYPERVKLELCPPDINRFCDFDFTE
jgi:site-specific DNA recombinase